jgi:ribosomal-protein-alanine N-acetyltransferase
MLFLVFGSSASGKTTAMNDVLPLVRDVEGHDFDEIGPPPGADTAWRHRAYGGWIERALECEKRSVDLLLCGQTPLGELLASPAAPELEAISACLIDCDDVTRAGRLDGRCAAWFARTAGHLQERYSWPEWVNRLETNAFYLARRREDDAIVGFLSISEIVRGKFQSAYLGYGAVAEFAGRGYLTEAMELLLREAFTRLRLHRLEANIQPGNTASIALARRCGFELEGFSPRYLKIGGRWRDHERWAITKESWRARRGG